MFQVKLLPQDLKEKAKLERRRALEEERKRRIFNPKERTIGIDVKSIQKQIEEKIHEKEIERENEKRYYQYHENVIKTADETFKNINETKKKLNQELMQYRQMYQRKENRREYYLTLPWKIEENDKLGVSSGQVFGGEDINKKLREKLQTEQQKNWLLQQMLEKNQTNKEFEFAEKMYQDCLSARDERAIYLEKLERDCRREMHKANLAYNKALAQECEFLKSLQKEKEREDKLMEICNAINSDLLTENPEVSQSNLGHNKVIQYHYKGMSEEECLEIRKTQLRQIQQNKVNLEAENTFNNKWDKYYESVDSTLASMEQLENHNKREYNKELEEENKTLNKEKQFQIREEMKKSASNFTTPEFLSKFNKSSR